MLASVVTFAVEGVESREIVVEVDLRPGLPAFTIVGLPDAAVRESRERVRAALLNSGLEFPLRRVTANLAPADVRKSGPAFDLALAVALLAASAQLPAGSLDGVAVFGELSLGGALRRVPGALALALGAREAGCVRLIVPEDGAGEAALADGVEVLGVPTLAALVELLHGRASVAPADPAPARPGPSRALPDLAEVRGQPDARRALEIAAAGGHNLLLVGPPGCGKTMLARRLPGILPPPSLDEAIEITKVQSIAGLGDGRLAAERPFRAPHHSISAAGLIGGGATPRPGEITLAHRGVLFLDELGEFSRLALEALRQPLEEGEVTITRGQRTLSFPARFMLVAASNGCGCARPAGECRCDERELARFAQRLSGALLDRIELVCELGPAPALGEPCARAEPSATVRARVLAAHERRAARRGRRPALEPAAAALLGAGARTLGLSARAQHRLVGVARTIADLAGSQRIAEEHLDEALTYRVAVAAARAA